MARTRKISFDGITPQAPTAAPGAPATVDKGSYRSVGIGLKELELAEVEALAEQYDLSRNAIMRLAVIHFLEQVRAGKVNIADELEPPKPAKHRLRQDL